jgi:hypothetical protein
MDSSKVFCMDIELKVFPSKQSRDDDTDFVCLPLGTVKINNAVGTCTKPTTPTCTSKSTSSSDPAETRRGTVPYSGSTSTCSVGTASSTTWSFDLATGLSDPSSLTTDLDLANCLGNTLSIESVVPSGPDFL